jgi:hypothetical protein
MTEKHVVTHLRFASLATIATASLQSRCTRSTAAYVAPYVLAVTPPRLTLPHSTSTSRSTAATLRSLPPIVSITDTSSATAWVTDNARASASMPLH